MRHRDGRHRPTLHPVDDLLQRRRSADLELGDLRDVLEEPHPVVHVRVEGEHDPAPRDAAKLGEPGRTVGPVVDGEHRHHRVERPRRDRERLGDGPDYGSRCRRPLRQHHPRRLDGDCLPVRRLIGARPRPDIEHRARITERGEQRSCEASVGLSEPRVPASDLVVDVAAPDLAHENRSISRAATHHRRARRARRW